MWVDGRQEWIGYVEFMVGGEGNWDESERVKRKWELGWRWKCRVSWGSIFDLEMSLELGIFEWVPSLRPKMAEFMLQIHACSPQRTPSFAIRRLFAVANARWTGFLSARFHFAWFWLLSSFSQVSRLLSNSPCDPTSKIKSGKRIKTAKNSFKWLPNN